MVKQLALINHGADQELQRMIDSVSSTPFVPRGGEEQEEQVRASFELVLKSLSLDGIAQADDTSDSDSDLDLDLDSGSF